VWILALTIPEADELCMISRRHIHFFEQPGRRFANEDIMVP
jgi:hypothetical protein